MSVDGDTVRDWIEWATQAVETFGPHGNENALAALARLEAAEAKLDEREKWFAHAVESWKQEEQDWIEQRDALAEKLVEHHAVGVLDGAMVGDICPICRAALAEAGPE